MSSYICPWVNFPICFLEIVISSGCELHLHWVAGHTGLAPNELADIKAKDAAIDAALLVDTPHPVTIKDIKRDARAHTIKIWQRRWDRLNEKRLIHRCHPKIRSMRLRSKVSKQAESALIRLITGHNITTTCLSTCHDVDSRTLQIAHVSLAVRTQSTFYYTVLPCSLRGK